jgi:hypothetical protein
MTANNARGLALHLKQVCTKGMAAATGLAIRIKEFSSTEKSRGSQDAPRTGIAGTLPGWIACRA